MRRLLLRGLLLSSLVVTFTSAQPTHALNGNDFPFGRIIDAPIFHDSDSMTVAEIQAFLESKVQGGSCDRYRPTYNSNYNPPWTCLFEFQQNPTTGQNNYGQFNPDGSPASVPGGQSAAQIIWQASQDYGVNPQVLIVLLQKEQGLVTDNWPWTIQYSKATGYRCPDTAPCDPAGADFVKQVRGAAASFIYYMDNDGLWYPVGANNILYNPNQSCGRRPTNIENLQTSALYLYTPYVPNQAALDNLYDTGDSCSAYGNRNFWRYFNDWFGSTHVPTYASEYVGGTSSVSIIQGERQSIYIRFRNTGNRAWYDSISAYVNNEPPVRLATDGPLNRSSAFSASWPHPSRAATTFGKIIDANGNEKINNHIVEPGEIAEFWLSINSSLTTPTGSFLEGLRPIVESVGATEIQQTYSLPVSVEQAVYSASFRGQSAFPRLIQGETAQAFFAYENTGNTTWYDSVSAWSAGHKPVRLGTNYPLNRPSDFGSNWELSNTRAANVFGAVFESDGVTLASNQNIVEPGQVARFDFDLKANLTKAPGFYPEAFRPLVEGYGPMNNVGTWLGVTVVEADYSASFHSQSPFPTVTRGTSEPAFFAYENTGNTTWYDSVSAWSAGHKPVRLGTNYPLNRPSDFGSNWELSNTRAANVFGAVFESDGVTLTSNQHVVHPGEIVRFDFDLSATASQPVGFYPEAFRPLVEGYGPMNNVGTWLGVTVD